MWAAWTLPDVLPVVAEFGLADELRRLLRAASPRTTWYEGAEAFLGGDHTGSAAVYARIGSRPDEADALLRHASQAPAGKGFDDVERCLAAAADFYRSVGAHARLREVEAVTAART
jgi:hypothetical protein